MKAPCIMIFLLQLFFSWFGAPVKSVGYEKYQGSFRVVLPPNHYAIMRFTRDTCTLDEGNNWFLERQYVWTWRVRQYWGRDYFFLNKNMFLVTTWKGEQNALFLQPIVVIGKSEIKFLYLQRVQ